MSTERVVLIGSEGQVGQACKEVFETSPWTLTFLKESDLDLTNLDQIPKTLNELKPDFVINAAAYTKVDQAEEDSELCELINSRAPGVIAKWCADHSARLVHYSTDYVYDGAGDTPRAEDTPISPLNTYGKTKAAGDQAIQDQTKDYWILRTSWVYSHVGQNFLKTMLRLGAEKKELNIVGDQVGSPTYAPDLARVTQTLLEGSVPTGVYHCTNGGFTSWFGFAKEIFSIARERGFKLKLSKLGEIPTSEFPTPAKRPLNSRLDLAKIESALGKPMRSWKEALRDCLERVQA